MSTTVRVVLGGATLALLTVLERRRPLRQARHRPDRRLLVNLAMGSIALAASAALHGPVTGRVMAWAERRGVGLCRWLRLPPVMAGPVSVVLLDYTLWHWHRWNHASGRLWRFHASHHLDHDLDASTALRFHPGELLLSVPFRALQVALIGARRRDLAVWEALVMLFVQFHHSNVRLPAVPERMLGWMIITPRVHGIHHSRRPRELHSNFGTILSLWDRLHRLRVDDVPQDTIDVGIPGERGPRSPGLAASLALPFRRRAPRRA